MQLVDTHCHIHEAQYELPGDDSVRARWLRANKPEPDVMIAAAAAQDVNKLICVGTSLADSQLAVDFVQNRANCWATIGIHPHEAKYYVNSPNKLQLFSNLVSKTKVVAIGECGLDYYYEHSPKGDQKQMLRFQIELALQRNLPMIFHVREAFEDFWPILDEYGPVKGVVHSFTDAETTLQEVINRDLFIGLNGIMTFTKDEKQLKMAKKVPLEWLLLETDAPFLTPKPFRGTICEPKHLRVTAEFLASHRGENLADLATATTRNAHALFGI